MFIKQCPKCGENIEFSNKGNYNRSIKNNSVCKKCVVWTQERKNKIRIKRVEYLNQISDEEKQQQINKMSDSLKKMWCNKTPEEIDEWRKNVSFITKQRWKDKEYKHKLKQKIKQSWNNLSVESKKLRIQKSLDNGAGVCRYSTQYEYKVYGQTEKRYIKHLVENNKLLPLKNTRTAIKTPYGLYFPDFEFDEHYVEIKSNYTFSKLINKLSYDGKTENKQLDKIMWVSNNIKKVKVIVETKRNYFSEVVEIQTSI